MKKYYEVETGILLNPDDKEYDAYKYDDVYGGKLSFYDDDQFATESLEEAEAFVNDYVKKGVEGSYGIIKGPFEDNYDNVEDLVDFTYDINSVYYCICKKNNDIVENFLFLEEGLKEESIKEDESLEEVKENKEITEAPDDDGIMSDDELDAEEGRERADFEARMKARRDKVAQQRADRDAKIAKEKELKAKADEIAKTIGDDWSFEHLFDVLVPDSGKCDTLAGEIIRAINKLEYRWFNDGDRWFEDYGIETCGPAARFLMNVEIDDENPFYDNVIMSAENDYDDEEYDDWIEGLKNLAVGTIKEYPTLLAKETSDMFDINYKDVEEWLDEQGLIPTYDIDCSLPRELEDHLDAGNISERDLVWEVESWIDNIGDARYDSVTFDWGELYVNNCNKSVYNELDGGSTLYKWLEDYAQELTNEYGDPNEEEDEPEEDEEGEE